MTSTDTLQKPKDQLVTLVVAAADNNAIGKNNQLLWHLPNDMRFFKNITWGLAVVMGRKTFEALGKPLPGRTNIVITRQAGWKADSVLSAGSVEEALQLAREKNFKEVAVIGGGEIYHQSMDLAGIIYLTRVHATLEADTFFPEIDTGVWELVSQEDLPADERHQYAYSFQKWQRRQRQ